MVDSVKSTVSRVDPQVTRGKPASPKPEPVEGTKNAAQQADMAASAGQAAIKEMAATAPIDVEAVKGIKEAIKRGEYPVDLDRVSDALMDAYRDLKA